MELRGNLAKGFLVLIMIVLITMLVATPAGGGSQTTGLAGGGSISYSPDPVAIPTLINYQGYLTDSSGNPINGTLEMTFSIYETVDVATPVWTETHPSVSVTDGLFNVLLGSINPIEAWHLEGQSFLGITVGTDDEMVPRQQLVSVAYALRSDVANLASNAEHAYTADIASEAGVADTVDGMDSSDFAPVGHDHDAEYVNVTGDNMTGPLYLEVGVDSSGILATTDVGSINPVWAIRGEHGGSGNWGEIGAESSGVYGYGNNNPGVMGYSNNLYAVYGEHTSSGSWGCLGTQEFGARGLSTAGIGVHGDGGVLGVSGNSDSGSGVYGGNYATGNWGLIGTSDEGAYGEHLSTGNYGRLGTGNEGVRGEHSVSGNYGLLGTSTVGVYGINMDSLNYGRLGTASEGVYGEHEASGNHGLLGTSTVGAYGRNNATGNYGRLGTSGEGVYGHNQNTGNYGRLGTGNDGVAGTSTQSAGSGVYGINTSTGYGVYGRQADSSNYGYLGTSNYGVYGYGNTVSDYDFYAGGPGTDYGPFTGAHEVRLCAEFPEGIEPGLIVSVTGETQVRTEEGKTDYSSTLPTVQLSATPNDSKVLGVLISESPVPEDHWYEADDGERFGIVNALGEGRVWVTNISGDIEAGDYITTSAITGYGQKQDDDLLHSYTLGKAIETAEWSKVTETVDFDGQTYKAYPIAVVYTSG